MSEIPRYIKYPVTLAATLLLPISASVLSARIRANGPDGFLYLNNLSQGMGRIRAQDISNPKNYLEITKRNSYNDYNLSPDGNQVVYTKDNQAIIELHVVNINGSHDKLLTPGMEGSAGKWSPDGKLIVFSGWKNTGQAIWITDPNSEKLERLTTLPLDRVSEIGPIWSPDNKTILYSKTFWPQTGNSYDELWQINKDGTQEKSLLSVSEGSISDVEFSPNGKEIIFRHSTHGNISNIYKFNLETNQILNFRFGLEFQFNAHWSPDGQQILIQSSNDGTWKAYIVTASGKDQKIISDDPYADIFKWGPDGKSITFSTFKNEQRELHIMNIETLEERVLVEGKTELDAPFWLTFPK